MKAWKQLKNKYGLLGFLALLLVLCTLLGVLFTQARYVEEAVSGSDIYDGDMEYIVAEQVEAIKNVKIDKVTVWDGGEGKDGKTATAGFLSGLLKSLPPLEEMYNMAGLSLPKIVSPQKEQTVAEKEDKPERFNPLYTCRFINNSLLYTAFY